MRYTKTNAVIYRYSLVLFYNIASMCMEFLETVP